MNPWLGLALGSMMGGFARYWVSVLSAARWGTSFPFGTFLVNVSGCFLMGALNALAQDRAGWSAGTRLFWMSGFCGGFTTFSALMLETSSFMKSGETLRAAAYIGLSMAIGFLFFRLGEMTVRF